MSSKKELSSLQKQISMLQTEVDHLKGVLRPEPKLKEGQMVWVKYHEDVDWAYSNFSGFKNGKATTCRSNSNNYRYTWDEYSILNPYPDSIEARAIELLRRFNEGEYTDELFDVSGEFLKEIDNYKQ